MFYTETRYLETEAHSIKDITPEIREILAASGIQNGLLVVEVPHSTASVMRTTGGPLDIRQDLVNEVRRVVPSRINFLHEESPVEHIRHNGRGIIVKDGKLVSDGKLGWFFMEYDGPRARKYCVAVMGE